MVGEVVFTGEISSMNQHCKLGFSIPKQGGSFMAGSRGNSPNKQLHMAPDLFQEKEENSCDLEKWKEPRSITSRKEMAKNGLSN